ncbi:hypothetical protein [Nesterenkonia pannonica]|uniref:hypothetical protein n=1 Tax=Nesterenkonia pannonica TaxID=1548602 RepID=UPI002164E19F|nr:hypothetical protein [Nesterenkonia pannonica]
MAQIFAGDDIMLGYLAYMAVFMGCSSPPLGSAASSWSEARRPAAVPNTSCQRP